MVEMDGQWFLEDLDGGNHRNTYEQTPIEVGIVLFVNEVSCVHPFALAVFLAIRNDFSRMVDAIENQRG